MSPSPHTITPVIRLITVLISMYLRNLAAIVALPARQDARSRARFESFELPPDIVDLKKPQHDINENHEPECERRVEACGNPLHVAQQPGRIEGPT